MARADKRAHLPEKVEELDAAEHYSDTSRIKGLSDGVFSIAMTLLAFTLIESIPKPGDGDMPWSKMASLLLIYAVSFIILGVYWVGHAIQFHYVIRADRPLMVRTVLFLLFVSLVPFSAFYLGTRETEQAAIALYCANLIGCGIFLQATLMHATKDPHMLHRVMDKRIFRGISAAFLAGPILYALAFLIALINPLAGFVLCVATPIITFFPNPFWGRVYARFVGNREAAREERHASSEPR